MAGAEDDNAWMRDGAGELEAELAARQAELEQSARSRGGRGGGAAAGSAPAAAGGGFDAQQLAEQFKVGRAASTCSFGSTAERWCNVEGWLAARSP